MNTIKMLTILCMIVTLSLVFVYCDREDLYTTAEKYNQEQYSECDEENQHDGECCDPSDPDDGICCGNEANDNPDTADCDCVDGCVTET